MLSLLQDSQAAAVTSRSLTKKDKAMTISTPCFCTDKTSPMVIQMSIILHGMCPAHTHRAHHLPVSISVRPPLCTEEDRTRREGQPLIWAQNAILVMEREPHSGSREERVCLFLLCYFRLGRGEEGRGPSRHAVNQTLDIRLSLDSPNILDEVGSLTRADQWENRTRFMGWFASRFQSWGQKVCVVPEPIPEWIKLDHSQKMLSILFLSPFLPTACGCVYSLQVQLKQEQRTMAF